MSKGKVIQVYRIGFRPLNDIIIPVYSSKLAFTLFTRFINNKWIERLKRLHELKAPLKPYRFSPIFTGNNALFKNSRDNVLVLYRGKVYWFTVTLIGMEPEFSFKNELEVYGGVINLEEIEVFRKYFSDLVNEDEIDLFKIFFRSPTFLSPKLCLPPKVKVKTKYKVYRLYPQPCLWVRSLISYWNKYSPPNLKFKDGYRFSRLADIYLMETSYDIRQVTAYYSKNNELIEHRGFIGWIKYRVIDKEFSKRLAPLLRLAELVGIGKSRSIGFGYVNIEY